MLAISGAFLATLSTQVPDMLQKPLAWLGAVCLAAIPVISQRKLPPKQTRAWIRARSASEGLKAECYKYFAQAEPYQDPATAESSLYESAKEIENDIEDLARYAVNVDATASTPPGTLTPDEYIEKRVQNQVDWYRDNARLCRQRATSFRNIEMVLALIAAALAAAAGAWDQDIPIGPTTLSFGTWVAVLTTIGGTITAHVSASRYDYLDTSYSSTARKLNSLLDEWSAGIKTQEWSDFVVQCENVISNQNESWMVKWSKEDEHES